MPLSHLFVAILLASLFGFGGLGSLPVLRSQLESNGIAPGPVVLPALAVGNISPGPNGLYLIAVSYFLGGVTGSLLACVAVVIPPFLVLLLERARERLIHLMRFRAMLRALALGVVALLFVTDWSLVRSAAHGPLSLVVIVAGAVMLLVRVPPVVGVLAAILVGTAW
jgi:chromate transporter